MTDFEDLVKDRENKVRLETVVRVAWYGPSDTRGSRFAVTDMRSGKRKVFSRNLAEDYRDDQIDAIVKLLGDDLRITSGWKLGKYTDFFLVTGWTDA